MIPSPMNQTIAVAPSLAKSLPMHLPVPAVNNLLTKRNAMHPLVAAGALSTSDNNGNSLPGDQAQPAASSVSPAEDVPCLPRPLDVLLGRGKSNLNHPGNKYFQELIHMNRDRYFSIAATMEEKRIIVMNIVEYMQRTGRYFLKEKQREGKCSVWVRLSDEAARHKVAHALQYRQRRTVSKQDRTQGRQRKVSDDEGNATGGASTKKRSKKPRVSKAKVATSQLSKQSSTLNKGQDEHPGRIVKNDVSMPSSDAAQPKDGHGELLELLLGLRQSEPKPPAPQHVIASLPLAKP